MCGSLAHNAAQNSYDNMPSCSPGLPDSGCKGNYPPPLLRTLCYRKHRTAKNSTVYSIEQLHWLLVLHRPQFNPLTGTLKPQSNGPLYSNFGTMAVDGWAAAPPSPLIAVPNVTPHPSTASVPTSY